MPEVATTGSMCAVFISLDKATRLFPLSHVLGAFFSMDQTADDFPRAWDFRRTAVKNALLRQQLIILRLIASASIVRNITFLR
jgi:hypothetical protein